MLLPDTFGPSYIITRVLDFLMAVRVSWCAERTSPARTDSLSGQHGGVPRVYTGVYTGGVHLPGTSNRTGKTSRTGDTAERPKVAVDGGLRPFGLSA